MAEQEVYISVDIEADGPIPGDYSMLSLGAVRVGPQVAPGDTFYVELRPISDRVDNAALAVSGLDRKRLAIDGCDPAVAMRDLSRWAKGFGGRPVFVSFSSWDWGYVYYYLLRFTGESPFGHSSLDIKSFYMGRYHTTWAETSTRYLLHGESALSHNALDDARIQGELFWRALQDRATARRRAG
jgi:hypothetical protein